MLVAPFSNWFRPAAVDRSPSMSFISLGTTLKGDVSSDAPVLRIDGHVEGDVHLTDGLLTIGQMGSVAGNIDAKNIRLVGRASGRMSASERIECMPSAVFKGHLMADGVSVSAGAKITGTMALTAGQTQASVDPVPRLMDAHADVASPKAMVASAG